MIFILDLMEATLTQRAGQGKCIATCVCGNQYNLAQRTEAKKNLQTKNTAANYCSDPCWALDIAAMEDYS